MTQIVRRANVHREGNKMGPSFLPEALFMFVVGPIVGMVILFGLVYLFGWN